MSSEQGILILENHARALTGTGIRRQALQGALITTSIILGVPFLRSMEAAATAL